MDSSGRFLLRLPPHVCFFFFFFFGGVIMPPFAALQGCDCSFISPYAWITKLALSQLHVVYQHAVSQTQPSRGPGLSLRTHALICQTSPHRMHIQHRAVHDGVYLPGMTCGWEPDLVICIHGCTFSTLKFLGYLGRLQLLCWIAHLSQHSSTAKEKPLAGMQEAWENMNVVVFGKRWSDEPLLLLLKVDKPHI